MGHGRHFAGGRFVWALLIPLAALALQWIFWDYIDPFVWFLFFPAVFLSARIGGLWGGLASTVISTLLAWYFFIPPRLSWQLEQPGNLWSIGLFLVMGWLFSDAQERLRRANQRRESALEETRAANEHISHLYQKTLELDELKTQFFANVSHELRTPLTLILGPVGKCLAGEALDADSRQSLEMVERNANFLYRRISDLLDVAKLEAKSMHMRYTRLDLAHLVRTTGSNFESLAAGRGIGYTLETPPVLSAQVDAEKVQHILLNLLSNAFKFTPDGGEVSLRLGSEDGQAILEVRDSGPGIPENMREAVFERFRQVEGHAARRHGGTGLGLAIVREYGELHGGSVGVTARPGGGARFAVRLPLTAPAGAEMAPANGEPDQEISRQVIAELHQERVAAPGPVQAPPADAPLVLVVEDNPDMNAYVVGALRGRYRVEAAFNGREGLAKALAIRPDLIISDLMMPEMSGDQMLAELSRNPEMAEASVIVLTAKADEALRVKMLMGGALGYLNKPFSLDELLALVGGLLADKQKATAARLHLAAIVEASGDAIIGKTLDGVITTWNRGAERIFGYAAAEAVGKSLLMLFPPGGEDEEREILARILRGEIVTDLETVRIRKDGQPITISATISPIKDRQGRVLGISKIARDVSERKRMEREREITSKVLGLLNTATDSQDLLRSALACLKEWSGCEAVGIRLREGEDYPYFETSGFPVSFVELENSLCSRDEHGRTARGADGRPVLDCMCGNVIQGRFDPAKPFFTTGGGFWSNCTTELLATTTDAERQARTRNRCNGAGYESVALLPLRSGSETFGLLQFNDKRKGCFSAEEVATFERLAVNIAGFLAKTRAEERLRQSEQRYRLVVDNANEAIVVAQDGMIRFFNPRALELSGYSAEEYSATPLIDHVHPEDRPVVREHVQRRLAGLDAPQSLSFRILDKQGRVKWVYANSVNIDWQDGPAILSLLGDITEHKRSEEALRESEEHFRFLFENMLNGYAYCRMIAEPGQPLDFVYLQVNKAFEKLTGLADVAGKRVSEVIPGIRETDPELLATYDRVASTGVPERFEVHVEALNMWFSVSVYSPLREHFVAVFDVITERKQAELALRQSQAAVRGLLDATTDMIALVDRQYVVQATNEVAGERLGGSPSGILGRCVFDFLPEDVGHRHRAHFDLVLSSGQPLRFQDERQGSHFDNNLFPVIDDQGRITGIAVYARDITQAVRDEAKRAALERQLQQAQKMEAIGTLAGGIAHDFNNILGIIGGYAEMAMDDARTGEVDPLDLEQVIQAAERAKDLVRQILTFSRKVEVEYKPLDLNKEVAQATQLMGQTIPKMIRIETDLVPDLGVINANANQMEQILLNLGTNAADAMPEGGRLTIKTRNFMVDERPCLTCGELFSGPHVALVVTDTGQGMDPQTIEHIFEPFYTTKEPGQGTGLGLSTVHGIVTGHGGHITCASAPGQGTAFTLYFPVLQTAGENPPRREHSRPQPGGHETILLVDDEDALLYLGSRILEQAGYAVRRASTGEQAIRVFQEDGPKPDLVVMDLGMPGMGGKRALEEIRGLRPEAKVVIASGYGADGRVQEALHSGAAGFVAKPYGKDDLLNTVRGVLDQT